MKQSKTASLVETVAGVAIGFAVSLMLTALVLPVYGFDVSFGQNLQITLIFTLASIARGYGVRRVFNWIGARNASLSK
jgi:hypothetical protein